jgi:hypothetical protein
MTEKEMLSIVQSNCDKLTIQQLDDALLFYYNTSASETFRSHVYDDLQKKHNLGLFQHELILRKLVKDGYITEVKKDYTTTYPNGKVSTKLADYYQISFDGVLFHEQGGYLAFQQREQQRFRFERRKMRLELRQIRSTIKINTFQKWIIGLATLFSAVSLIISILDYKKDTVINVPPPTVVIQQLQSLLRQDTSSQNTLQNPQPLKKKKTF